MSGVTGVVIAGGIAAAAGVGGALISKSASANATEAQVNASNSAANAQLQGTRESIAAQQAMADKGAALYQEQAAQAQGTLAPFVAAQTAATQQLQGLSDINNPLYQQEEKYNTSAIQRQLAAQGLLRSKSQVDLLSNLQLGLDQQRAGYISQLAGNGAAQTSAQISQGLGSQLSSLYGGLGTNLGSSYQQGAAGLANSYLTQGQAIGQGALAQGQATAGMLTGINNSLQGSYGNYLGLQQQAQLMQLLNRSSFQTTGTLSLPAYLGKGQLT